MTSSVRPLRWLLPGLLCMLVVRVATVDNPWVWQIYASKLHPEEIGWRQHSAVVHEADSHLSPPADLRLLAVGSSQTEAVYGGLARARTDLAVFELAAMGPFDFVTYADRIARQRPEAVLLYLSDFDIAREPDRAALVLAPRQGRRLPGLARELLAARGDRDVAPLLAELTVGEVFPEFKYRFVFRGIVDKAIGHLAAGFPPDPRLPPERETVGMRIAALRASIAVEPMAFNLRFLERFLERMASEGIAVHVIEGQYSPLVSDARTRRIAERTRNEIEVLLADRPGARYIPRDELPALGVDDYVDLTHVTPEAGERFAAAVLERVGASP